MKPLYYIIFILEFVFFLFKKLCRYMYSLFSFIWEKLYVYRSKLYESLRQKTTTPKKKEEKIIVQNITMQINTAGVVGKTKTEFLSQADLPKFDKNEVIESIPLESESVINAEEEPEIDPNEVDIETIPQEELELRKLLEEENDDSDLYDELPPEDDLSMAMGVSLNELDDTLDTLTKEDYTQEEKDKAQSVFRKIEGTVFLQFYLMQNECMERAKIFMQEIDAQDEVSGDMNTTTSFDMNKYI